MKVYPKDLAEQLEFNQVLVEIENRCVSPQGKERVAMIRPMSKISEIRKLLMQTNEMVKVEMMEDTFPIPPSTDTRSFTKQLEIEDFVLETISIHHIRKMVVSAGAIIKFFSNRSEEYPTLFGFIERLTYTKEINNNISDILDNDGNIKPNASPELSRIKKSIDTLNRDLSKAFSTALKRLKAEGKLGDVEESMRNNRRVLGVASEHKRQVQGIIHDESETGKTAFIEPEAVVHIQNQLFEMERAYQREVYRLMKELCNYLRPQIPLLENYQWLLSVIDVTRAKARYALSIEAAMPRLSDQPIIHLYEARHPLLWMLNKKQKKKVVPLNIEMNEDNRLVVISGPNAGGKSVAMKTVGLLQWMAQSGLLIPAADQSKIGVFTTFLADIGDSQSLEDELSTYSSRLMKMNAFLKMGNAKALLLIDEFGTGTDPSMGGAIAEAAMEALNNKKVFGVITTHYANLKSFAENHPGIINASMLYDEVALKPAYQLEMGKPGSSYAMEIAEKSGLSEELIAKARSLLSKEHVKFEELLKSVRVEKEHLKLRERELNRSIQDLKKREQTLKDKIKLNREKEAEFQRKRLVKQQDSIREMEAEFKGYMQELKDALPADQHGAREKLRQFIKVKQQQQNNASKKIRRIVSPSPKEQLIEGAIVTLVEGDQTGEIERIQNDKAVVIFGNMKSTVPLRELKLADATIIRPETKSSVKVNLEEETVFELDIRGMDKFTAMEEVEKFLDGALVRNFRRVRIIHGVGTGVLREAVLTVVKQHPSIASYEHGKNSDAGHGSTIVLF